MEQNEKVELNSNKEDNIPNNENIINKEESNNIQELPLKDQLIKEYGFYANINGEDFDPREVTVLSGDEKNREITQIIKFLFDSYPVEAINYCLQRCYYKTLIIKFLFDSYPVEAINYCLQRCYYKTFSRCSLLDKIMKYLLEKHKDNGDQTINQLIWSYQENTLNIDISTVKDFNDMNKQNFGNSELHMMKLVFYDYSKEGVEYKKFNINEIFIEINSKYIFDEDKKENVYEGLTLEENDDQLTFLGNKHHLFKRFCRRKGNFYVFNFVGFENKKITRNIKKKNKNKKEEYDESCAIFKCEAEGCRAIYTYNFSSNRFRKKEPHDEVPHEIKKDAPNYYQQNIQLLKDKNYITDIQLVKVDK